jgi:hypothetical protein
MKLEYRKTIHFRKKIGEFSFNRSERRCKGNAKFRGLTYSLTSEEYRDIVSSPCHYCGYKGDNYNPYYKKTGELGCFKTVDKEWADKQWITINGIDRKDNSIGYIFDNCIPCCKICNYAKHNKTYDQFINYIDNLCKFRGKIEN